MYTSADLLAGGAYDGDFGAVDAALEAGADVNGHPEQVCTPLVGATFAEHADMISFLLEKGADPNGSANTRRTCPACSGQEGERRHRPVAAEGRRRS